MSKPLKKDQLILDKAQQAILPIGQTKRFDQCYDYLNSIEKNRAYSVIWYLTQQMNWDDFTDMVIGYKKLKEKNLDAWTSLMTTLWGNIFENDDLDKFNQLVAKTGFNHITLLRIDEVLEQHQKQQWKENPSSGKIFMHIKAMNLDWQALWQEMYDNGGFQYRVVSIRTHLLHELSPQMPQWLKDTFLDSSVYSVNPRSFNYWIKQGADIELKALDKPFALLMNRNIRPQSRLSQNKETREVVVQHFPESRKNQQDAVWSMFVDYMLDSDKATDYEVGDYIKKGYIEVPEKGSKHENKFWRSFVTIPASESETLIDRWIEKNIFDDSLSARLYKLAVTHANEDLVHLLLKKSIDTNKFIKSQAFRNIASEGSLLKNAGSGKNEVLHNLKIVKAHHLYQTITQEIETNSSPSLKDEEESSPKFKI
jgi:hypothetical protein